MADTASLIKTISDALNTATVNLRTLQDALSAQNQPQQTVSASAKPTGTTTVQLDWSTNRTDITGWKVGRDGVDAGGTGAWSTEVMGSARGQVFSSLLPGTRYTFTLTPHTATGDLTSIISIATTTGGATTTPSGDGAQAAVKLNWGAVKDGDEFEYSGKPQSKWSLYSGQGHAGNGKRVPEAFNVSGGILTCSGDKGGNTGGMAFSRNQMYGRYEVRMRTYSVDPKAGGAKYHPVLILWPQDDRWPQGAEYDFFESDCDSGVAGCYMHYPSDKVEQQHFEKKLDIQNWHNYAIEWKKDAITGYIDGEQWWRITEARMQAPRPMHLTIQLDNFNGTNQCPGKMDVAWVRYYDV